jgi:hypothetical protein
MAPLEHADSALAAGSPLLAFAKPALSLMLSSFHALGGVVGDGNTFQAPSRDKCKNPPFIGFIAKFGRDESEALLSS